MNIADPVLSPPVAHAESCRKDASALLPLTGVFRILVCRPTHSLGNTLLLTPLLRELQSFYPGAEIDVVTRTPIGADLFREFSNISRVLCLPSRAVLSPGRFIDVLSHVRRTAYDLVVDPHPCSGTGRALLRLAHGRYKVGFSNRKDAALTHAIPVPASIPHTAQRAIHLLHAALGRRSMGCSTPDIGLTQGERALGRDALARLLDASDSTLSNGVIGVFANATGPKLLPASWWTSLLETVSSRYPAHTVVEIVPAFGRSMLGNRYLTFFSSDVRRLAGVLSQLSLFVSCDCGVMHLACATGVPVTGIFTATDPAEWGPYGPRDSVIDARGLTPEQVAEQIAVPGR